MKNYIYWIAVILIAFCTFPRMTKAQEVAIDGVITKVKGSPVSGAKVSINGQSELRSTGQGKFRVYLSKGDKPTQVKVRINGLKIKNWTYDEATKLLQIEMTESDNLLRGLVQENGKPLTKGKISIKIKTSDYEAFMNNKGEFSLSLPDDYTISPKTEIVVNRMKITPDMVEWHDGYTYVVIRKPDHLPYQVNEVLVADANFKPVANLRISVNGQLYRTKSDGAFATNPGTKSTDEYKILDYSIINTEYDESDLVYKIIVKKGSENQLSTRITEEDAPKETVIPITTDYTDDFHRITEDLEREKEILMESREHIIEEIEKIATRLNNDKKMNGEVRESLEAELRFLEQALEENDRTFQEAQAKTNFVIQNMKKMIQEKDSLREVAQEQLKIIEEEKREIEEQKEIIESKSKKNLIIFLIILLILTGLVAIFYRGIRKIRAQNIQLEETKAQLTKSNSAYQQANQELSIQKALVDKKNQDITASINYAERIQRSMLPDLETVKTYLPDSFIYFRPRDIVSGDFYWMAHIENDQKSQTILVVADCTGHGVPGAFMSMVGDALFNQVVKLQGYTEPHKILRELNIGVRLTLRQDATSNQDGMDVAISVIHHQDKWVDFGGAKNALFYVRNHKIHEARGSRKSIGGRQPERVQLKYGDYRTERIEITEPTYFYMSSDGYPDQFGGEENKKFTKKGFKNLLLEIYEKPFVQQLKIIERTMDEWKGNHRQIDDMLVIGFRLEP